jgi:hypothetical protein
MPDPFITKNLLLRNNQSSVQDKSLYKTIWKPFDSKTYFKSYIKDQNSTHLNSIRRNQERQLTLPFKVDAPDEEI